MSRLRSASGVALVAGVLTAMIGAGAGAAQATPAGAAGRIFFVSNASGAFNIYSMNSDGSGRRRITHSARNQLQVDRSPDGRTLLYSGDTPAGRAIFATAADGSGPARRLTTAAGVQTRPRWSPSGDRILYMSTQHGPQHVFAMNADGSGQRDLTPGRANSTQPAWAPYGQRIAFASDRAGAPGFAKVAVYLADPDGSRVRRLTPLRLNAGDMDFSPDGQSLVFSDNQCDTCGTSDIFRIRRDGTGLVRLTHSGSRNDVGPRFAPDGTRVTYISGRVEASTGEYQPQDVLTMRLNGTLVLNLTQTPRINDSDPIWTRQP